MELRLKIGTKDVLLFPRLHTSRQYKPFAACFADVHAWRSHGDPTTPVCIRVISVKKLERAHAPMFTIVNRSPLSSARKLFPPAGTKAVTAATSKGTCGRSCSLQAYKRSSSLTPADFDTYVGRTRRGWAIFGTTTPSWDITHPWFSRCCCLPPCRPRGRSNGCRRRR